VIKASIYIAVLIVGAIILPFTDTSSIPFLLISGIMIGIFVPLLDTFASNTRYMRLAYYSVRYYRQKVRVSVSYLFRIKVDNVYMLVMGRRWQQFQPVGGVYKMSADANSVMNDIGALDDDLVPVDPVSLHDLRIRIPATKILAFMRWFESDHSRETSPWREFQEELIGSGIVRSSDFPFIFSNFIRRYIPPIRFSPYAQSMEIFVADIYELLPTADQLTALRKLKEVGHPDVMWARENQIRHLGAVPGENFDVRIGEPAIWTL
jgi:hypothetical protein